MSAEITRLERPRAAVAAEPTVAVIVTTYNHARFLPDAIDSVRAQQHPADEIIVVDDGSEDRPERAIPAGAGIRFIRQANQGLAAARNTGLSATSSDVVVFLDADDRLLPNAIAAGLRCLASSPQSGLVYGGHRRIAADGARLGEDRYDAVGPNAYGALLRGNMIAMHATVMYRRLCLVAAGGFDASLPRCEDYDVYLRMARLYPIASYPETVAEYRWHGGNLSAAHREMLHWVLKVHARQRPFAEAATWRDGRRIWREYYAGQMLDAARLRWRRERNPAAAVSKLAAAATMAPRRVAREAARMVKRRLGPATGQPRRGGVRLGDLDRLAPIDDNFGFGRGTPIDRYYIEDFLERHASDIAGRVLEIGDDSYTRRFGGTRVTRSDVLHVSVGVPAATIIGDLASPQTLPANAFDCLVITQTLHLIYDARAAVAAMHRALKPGGIALVTVPGISPIDRHDWKDSWYWSFTALSAQRIFGELFEEGALTVEGKGNVFAATAFLQGLALEEVDRRKLEVVDEAYPVVVTVRAQKALASGARRR